jgi:hypothetical protein
MFCAGKKLQGFSGGMSADSGDRRVQDAGCFASLDRAAR